VGGHPQSSVPFEAVGSVEGVPTSGSLKHGKADVGFADPVIDGVIEMARNVDASVIAMDFGSALSQKTLGLCCYSDSLTGGER